MIIDIINSIIPSIPSDHLVPKNITISHLALRYKTSVKNLMKWNGLAKAKQLREGMNFYVRKPPVSAINSKDKYLSSSPGKISTGHRIIRVRSGDTLWGIAKLYRTTVKALKKINELESSNYLRPNQKLIVPISS